MGFFQSLMNQGMEVIGYKDDQGQWHLKDEFNPYLNSDLSHSSINPQPSGGGFMSAIMNKALQGELLPIRAINQPSSTDSYLNYINAQPLAAVGLPQDPLYNPLMEQWFCAI